MRILLADDHPLFAEALQILIQRSIPSSTLTVVSDLDAAHRALAGVKRFDLAIIDLHMPGTKGFEGVERTLARFPETPLAVISGGASTAEVRRAVELGARGFLPKTLPPKVIAAALQVIASGGTYVPTDYARPASPKLPTVAGLTPRETEVLALLSGGKSNKEIGRALKLQEITIKLHVRNIFRKLKVRNRVEAANAASGLGLDRTALD
ncbi:MAG TPA: response regulator transcription factor [Stellaceae bacterium]|nr:response regulator transcription factor [Stellaceae bacterium]